MKQTVFARLALMGAMALACQKSDLEPETKDAVVLGHGAWQGPYTWVRVVNRLQQQGYSVVNVELLAHGKDQPPAEGAHHEQLR